MKLLKSKLYDFIESVLNILHIPHSEHNVLNIVQFLEFGVVGLSNTIISYIVYAITLMTLKSCGLFPQWDFVIAQINMFFLSVLWSFYWNNKYVFAQRDGEKRSIWKALIKTYIAYSFTGLFLNSFLLTLWVQYFHISEYIAPIINLLFSVPINYLINKLWAFRS